MGLWEPWIPLRCGGAALSAPGCSHPWPRRQTARDRGATATRQPEPAAQQWLMAEKILSRQVQGPGLRNEALAWASGRRVSDRGSVPPPPTRPQGRQLLQRLLSWAETVSEPEVTAGGPGPPLRLALLHRSGACKPGAPEDSGPRLTRQAGLPVRGQGSTGYFSRTPTLESHDGKRKIPTATQTMTSGEDTRPGSRLPPPMTSPRRCSEGSFHSADDQGPLWPKVLIRQANQSSRTASDGPRLPLHSSPRERHSRRGGNVAACPPFPRAHSITSTTAGALPPPASSQGHQPPSLVGCRKAGERPRRRF